ncbi:hypothetical protein Nepgr_019052 [Nepenthes gracilis]|uniref:SET domain-containing protein n=1 Tax=Nepenthes gracilis TaxID=150966 RepID=A0AAD3SW89_NEPGR|nr:hypothetical protein Nepgr_019052 [Nepenthes gracilis]
MKFLRLKHGKEGFIKLVEVLFSILFSEEYIQCKVGVLFPMEAEESRVAMLTLLTVADIEGKGRGMVASQSLQAGQIILQESPVLIYSAFPLKQPPLQAATSSSFQYCAHCFRNLVGENGGGGSVAVTCPSCSHPHDTIFCSPKCHSLALASTHTPWVCQSLNHLRNCPSLVADQADERQVQARFLVAAYNLAMVSPSNFQTLLSLDGGMPLNSEEDTAAILYLNSLISGLPLPEGISAPSLQLTAALLAKDKRNAFGLMEPFSQNRERSVRAYAIYPNASFFNHDCLPNACRFDYLDTAIDGNTDITVRMIHNVPQGREICLSYFPVNLGYSERQQRLLDDYGFGCLCDRCKVEANWSNKDDDDDEGEAMEEEDDEEMGMSAGLDEEETEIELGGDDNFPHAYFFLSYMCDRNDCGGTLAPLPPSCSGGSNVMECNVCGHLKSEEEMKCES